MKRFIQQLSLFFVFAGLSYIVMVILVGSQPVGDLKKNLKYKMGGNGYMFTRLKEADTTRDVDVLFLGSSHAYRGYDPRIFESENLKVFNLGSSSQSLIQTNYLVDKYLNQLNPKCVVLDIFPMLLKSDGVESGLDLIANDDFDKRWIEMALNINDIKVYNSLIFDTFVDLSGQRNLYTEPLEDTNGDRYIRGGYVESYSKYVSRKREKVDTYGYNDVQIEALNTVLRKLKENDIPFIIAQAPILPERYDKTNNTENIDSVLSSFGPYYNFNNTMQLGDSLFVDDSHLNQYGVDIYNQKLVKLVKEMIQTGKLVKTEI